MKVFVVSWIVCVLASPVFAQTGELQGELYYVGEFETAGPPLAIAADSEGRLYYTVFTSAAPNQTRCYFVENPLAEILTASQAESHMVVDAAVDTEVPAGRGYHAIAVDSEGYVYLVLESGSDNTASVRKLSPAPEWRPVEAFADGIVHAGKRFNGVAVMDDDTIALTTFNTVEFWNAIDASYQHQVVGGRIYQRSIAYNSNNGDLYISRNGAFSVDAVSVVRAELLLGILGYSIIETGFILTGAVSTEFGVNAQLISYDAENDYIILPDHSEIQARVAFYNPDNRVEAAFYVDGSESPNGPLVTPAQAAVHASVDMEATFYFVTDNASMRVMVFADAEVDIGVEASVANWALY